MVIYYARVFFTLQFVNVNILLNIHLFTYFVSPLLRYGSFCLKLFYRVFYFWKSFKRREAIQPTPAASSGKMRGALSKRLLGTQRFPQIETF